MEKFKLTSDYIQLNQLLKAVGWCENGGNANSAIESQLVKVNDIVELRKRNKIMKGFKVEFNGNVLTVE